MENETRSQPEHLDAGKDDNLSKSHDGTTPEPRDRRTLFRKYFLYVLIGGVVIAAIVSIAAILIGEINDYIARALLTTLSMVIHAMIALAFMSTTEKHRTTGREIVVNTLFAITVASFFTTTLGIWKVIGTDVTGDFYQLYFYAIVASLIIWAMLGVQVLDTVTNRLMRISVGLVCAMWVYLIPSVFDDGYPRLWPEIYYRGIAAVGILLGTMLVLTAIFHKLYLTKHPEVSAILADKAGTKKHMPVWMVVVLFLIGVPVALWILGIISAVFRLIIGL